MARSSEPLSESSNEVSKPKITSPALPWRIVRWCASAADSTREECQPGFLSALTATLPKCEDWRVVANQECDIFALWKPLWTPCLLKRRGSCDICHKLRPWVSVHLGCSCLHSCIASEIARKFSHHTPLSQKGQGQLRLAP